MRHLLPHVVVHRPALPDVPWGTITFGAPGPSDEPVPEVTVLPYVDHPEYPFTKYLTESALGSRCPDCDGRGEPCRRCGGNGWAEGVE